MIFQFLLLLALLNPAASPATTISVTPVTAKPVVFANDLIVGEQILVHGPWFKTAFAITTDELITVIGVEHFIFSSNGGPTTSYYTPLLPPIEVAAHQLLMSDVLYVGRLPDQANFIYNVEVRLIGWLGSKNSSGPIVHASTSLQTE